MTSCAKLQWLKLQVAEDRRKCVLLSSEQLAKPAPGNLSWPVLPRPVSVLLLISHHLYLARCTSSKDSHELLFISCQVFTTKAHIFPMTCMLRERGLSKMYRLFYITAVLIVPTYEKVVRCFLLLRENQFGFG